MLKWIVPTLLALAARAAGQAAPPPAAAKGDATAALKAQCVKAAEGKSYTFETAIENDAPGPGGEQRDNSPIAGKVEIGGVSELKRGETLAYRKGEKLACKKKEAWELFKPNEAPAGGGGKGGRYGGGGGGGGGTEAKERGALRSLSSLVLPHELLATFDASLQDVKSSEADGKSTYTGTLTPSAATELSGAKELNAALPRGAAAGGKGGKGGGGGGGGGGAGAGAGGGGAFKATGTATLVFGKDGNAERVVIETQIKNKTNEYKQKRTITLREWGAAKITAPKDAAAVLGG